MPTVRIHVTAEDRMLALKARKAKYRSSPKVIAKELEYSSRPEVKAAMYRRTLAWSRDPRNSEKKAIGKRRLNLMDKYGITLQDYDSLLASQNSVCASCLGVNKSGRRLAVDHNHDTGAVRGLLCIDCNLALGLLKDSPEITGRMAEYIRKHTPVEAEKI